MLFRNSGGFWRLNILGWQYYSNVTMYTLQKIIKENPMKNRSFKNVLLVCMGIILILTACGVNAPAATPTLANTATATNTPTPTLTPTATLTPTKTPKPTITPNLAATQQYEDFFAVVQKVYDAGQISTLDGRYSNLDDYSDELAMGYGYSWNPTGRSAKNFIIRADFDWEVANQKNYSGCGYMFRADQYAVYYYIIALDGLNGVLLSYKGIDGNHPAQLIKKMDMPDMGSNPYQAQFTLVVTDTAAYTYVNGNFLTEHRLKSNWLTESGSLSSLVLTGSDTDYGTRCKITNAELWVIEP